MAIGLKPITERIIRPKRQGVPLWHVLKGDVYPVGTEAYLHLYDAHGDEVVFWPLTVADDTVIIDIDSSEWWPYREEAKSFTIFVIYPSTPSKSLPLYEGAFLGTS